jgi:Na+/melibiose symporter-like transporter
MMKNEMTVPPKEKFFFALGDFFGGAGGMITAVYAVFLAFNGLEAWAWATIILIAKTWDAVTDPWMGLISDNTRGRFGRRRPYIFLGGLLIIISMALLFLPLYKLNFEWVKFFIYLFSYLVFATVSTIISVPYQAMLNEITTEPEERNKINTLRLVFSMLSSALSAGVPMALVGLLQKGKMTVNRFSIIMIAGFGILYSVPLILSAIFSRERVAVPKEKKKYSFKEFIKPLMLKPFAYLVILYFAAFASLDLLFTNLIFLTSYGLRISYSPVILLGIIMASYAAMIPVHRALMKKHSKAFLYRMGIPVYLIGLTIFCLFPAGRAEWLLPFLALLIGTGLSGCQLLPWYIFPDVVDIGELKWGERNAGAFSGVMTFIRKTTAALAIGISGVILSIAGFIKPQTDPLTGLVTEGNQPSSAIWALRLVILVPVAIMITLAYFVSLKLKLSASDAVLVSHALELRREGKEVNDAEKEQLGRILHNA